MRKKLAIIFCLALTVVFFTLGLVVAADTAPADKNADLAQELTNPLADLMTIPIQMNYDQEIGAGDDGERLRTNIQPVIPLNLNENWNLISRTIVPVIYQDDIFPGEGSQFGLGDTSLSLFLSPKKATESGMVWGLGPIFLLPTATDSLLGGKKKVVSAAQKAFEQKEYAWGAQVIQYAYLLDPTDKAVRQLKADLLRQMGYRTTGSIARAFLLTEALTLEGKVTYPKLIPPSKEIIADSPDVFVKFFRVRIDPRKSENTDKVVEFVFTDKGNLGVALHVRGGIAEYVPVPTDHYRKADFVLKLDSETWAGLYLSAVSLNDAIDSGKVQLTGGRGEVMQIFDMFDKFNPAKNYMVPPLED